MTLARISDAKARARVLEERQANKPRLPTLDKATWEKSTAPVLFVKDPTTLVGSASKAPKDSVGDTYALMRERVRVLSGDVGKLAAYYATNLKRKDFDTAANRYGYAVALTRSNRGAQAVEQLQPLLAQLPDSVVLRLAMADAYLDAGRYGDATAIYKALHANSPRNVAVALGYAKALAVQGSTASAQQSAALLRPIRARQILRTASHAKPIRTRSAAAVSGRATAVMAALRSISTPIRSRRVTATPS